MLGPTNATAYPTSPRAIRDLNGWSHKGPFTNTVACFEFLSHDVKLGWTFRLFAPSSRFVQAWHFRIGHGHVRTRASSLLNDWYPHVQDANHIRPRAVRQSRVLRMSVQNPKVPPTSKVCTGTFLARHLGQALVRPMARFLAYRICSAPQTHRHIQLSTVRFPTTARVRRTRVHFPTTLPGTNLTFLSNIPASLACVSGTIP